MVSRLVLNVFAVHQPLKTRLRELRLSLGLQNSSLRWLVSVDSELPLQLNCAMLHFAADGDFLRYTVGSNLDLKDEAGAGRNRRQENYSRSKPVLEWHAASFAQTCVKICERLFRAGFPEHGDSET